MRRQNVLTASRVCSIQRPPQYFWLDYTLLLLLVEGLQQGVYSTVGRRQRCSKWTEGVYLYLLLFAFVFFVFVFCSICLYLFVFVYICFYLYLYFLIVILVILKEVDASGQERDWASGQGTFTR